ncbi:sensory histidine kinase DcuS [Salmonella enterica subsp. enterica serovar Agona str. 266757-1]|nr:sensory histidine kinase DcuS [Salmonella enterica subsp. enterica serovar Agona str. 266757-1]
MKHSLPCRALRKRPMKLGTTVILMVSAVLFFGARCGPSDLFFANQQHDARRAGR